MLHEDARRDLRGLRHNTLFHQLIQALIELVLAGSEERSLLESISNHVAAQGTVLQVFQAGFSVMNEHEQAGE